MSEKKVIPVGDMPSYLFPDLPNLPSLTMEESVRIKDWWWRDREVLRRMDEKIKSLEKLVAQLSETKTTVTETVKGEKGDKGDTGPTGPPGAPGTGSIPITATAPLTGGVITRTGNVGIQESSETRDGYLSATNFVVFLNKDRFLNEDGTKSWKMKVIEQPGSEPTGSFYDERAES